LTNGPCFLKGVAKLNSFLDYAKGNNTNHRQINYYFGSSRQMRKKPVIYSKKVQIFFACFSTSHQLQMIFTRLS